MTKLEELSKGTLVAVSGQLFCEEYIGRDGRKHLSQKIRARDVRKISPWAKSEDPADDDTA